MGLKDFFFTKAEEDEEPTVKETVVEETPAEPTAEIPVAAAPAAGQKDSKIADGIAAALEEANLDGYDYFEFAKAVEEQSSAIPSEQVRFQAMFAAGKAMGCTPEGLESSAKHYLGVIDQHQEGFETALKGQLTEKVTNRKQEAETTATTIQEKQALMEQITQEINDLHQRKSALLTEAATEEAKLATVKVNFDTTVKIFRDRITGDITKIQKYLGGAQS